MFPREASKRLCVGGCLPRPSEAKAGLSRRILLSLQRERASAFTLLELLIVVGIIAILLVLIAPAFTTIKSATDVTSASYTIKSALDTARTYAKTNNTYTWVGFYEEDVSQPSIVHGSDPCTGCVGRLVVSVAASQDGTTVYDPNNLAKIDTTKLIQVGKLTKIENLYISRHLRTDRVPVRRSILGLQSHMIPPELEIPLLRILLLPLFNIL